LRSASVILIIAGLRLWQTSPNMVLYARTFGTNRRMNKTVKIRTLVAPGGNLSEFDPGAYLSRLEFYQTSDELTEDDRHGMAQILHFLAFLAENAQSRYRNSSVVALGTSAYDALRSHFGDLAGWG